MNLENELKKNNSLMITLSSEEYKKVMSELNKELGKSLKKICYVSFSRPAGAIKEEFDSLKLSSEKYFILDTTSKMMGLKCDLPNVSYVSSPRALTELGLSLSKVMKSAEIKIIFFDSIGSALTYNDEVTAIRFLHSIAVKAKDSGKKLICIMVDGDLKKTLFRESVLFFDEVKNYAELEE